MADKTLKMWLQHVNSQVAEILNDYSRCIFLWNILQLLYMPFSCSPCPPTLFPFFPSFLFLSFFHFFFFGRVAVSGKNNTLLKPIRHFYNASLVVGKRAGRSRDWWERMIYVAAVSQLSSSPLSLIIAIRDFFPRAALSAHCLRKAIVFFSCHNPEEEEKPSASIPLLPPPCQNCSLLGKQNSVGHLYLCV